MNLKILELGALPDPRTQLAHTTTSPTIRSTICGQYFTLGSVITHNITLPRVK